ncbi:hypothetical protein [Aurantimonas sp. VKM B-3413]|nr:hypothetical protein [Aurantimonas sp. VKM B-3413]MCB8840325.1 hypothetical protein [Aurantimonas sp. VKM B-3413]
MIIENPRFPRQGSRGPPRSGQADGAGADAGIFDDAGGMLKTRRKK